MFPENVSISNFWCNIFTINEWVIEVKRMEEEEVQGKLTCTIYLLLKYSISTDGPFNDEW